MAEKETIEALKCLANFKECVCSDTCQYYMDNGNICDNISLAKDALDLISRYQTESQEKSKVIDQLQIKNECLKTKALIEDKTTATAIMAEYKQHWITTAYINKLKEEIQRLEEEIANYDPFYFCSIAGCEAASFACWKTCPDSVHNQTRAETIKELIKLMEDNKYKVLWKEDLQDMLKKVGEQK